MPADHASVVRLLLAAGPNSVERQRALAQALGDESGHPERGGEYWTLAGQLLTIKHFQGADAAVAAIPASVGATSTLGAVSSGMGGIAQKASMGIDTVQQFIQDHPVAAGATVAGIAGATAGAVTYAVTRKRKSKSSRRKTSRKSSGRRLKFGSPAWRKKYARKAAKSRKAGTRRNRRGGAVKDKYKGRKVYRTKRGQPYILMANGKARFIRA